MAVTVFDFFYKLLNPAKGQKSPEALSPQTLATPAESAFEPEEAPHNPEWPWPNFSPEELACKHCQSLPEELDLELLDKLEILRSVMGKPIRINSGHRCRMHNLAVGGAPYSQHKGLAVDIALQQHNPLELYKTCVSLGFLGIGLGGTFIHLDMRRKIDGHQPARKLTVWYYSESGRKTWQKLLNEDKEELIT